MLEIIRNNAQSFGIKLAFGLIIVVFVFWGIGNFRSAGVGAVASVNGEKIGEREFVQLCVQFHDQARQQYPNAGFEELAALEPMIKQQALQVLIVRKLLAQQAEQAGILITPHELRREIERSYPSVTSHGKLDGDLYRQVLAAQGTSPGIFENFLRAEMLNAKVQRMLFDVAFTPEAVAREHFNFEFEQRGFEAIIFTTSEFLPKIALEPEAARRFYDANPNDFVISARLDLKYVSITPSILAGLEKIDDTAAQAFYERNIDRYNRPERVRARHIIILADPAGTDERARAKTAIENAARQIQAGKSFADVARAVSQDGSAENGGDLGWFTRNQMVPAFEDAAFALTPGEVSAVVETEFGYHLIKLEERAAAGIQPFAEVREEIKTALAKEAAATKLQDAVDSLIEPIINGKNLEEAATAINITPRQTGLLPVLDVQDQLGLKSEDMQIVLGVEPGKVLDAALLTKDGYVLVEVMAHEPEALQPFETARPAIEGQLIEQSALKTVLEQANAARAGLTGDPSALPPDLKKRLRTDIAPMTRGGVAAGFAYNPDLSEALFATQSHDWLPIAYQVDGGVALVRMKKIIPPKDSDWKQVANQYANLVNSRKLQLLEISFLSEIADQSKITNIDVSKLNIDLKAR
jgi:peptidyl-prolyl cis-trans isomerase D